MFRTSRRDLAAQVDEALSRAAGDGRFGEDELVSMLSPYRTSQPFQVVWADESLSAQLGRAPSQLVVTGGSS